MQTDKSTKPSDQWNEIDWSSIVAELQSLATSYSGKEQLSSLAPMDSETEAIELFRKTEEFVTVLSHGPRPFMESLDLYPTWIGRLQKKATLKTLELKDIRMFLLETIALKEVLTDFSTDFIAEIKSQLVDAERPLSAIDQIMTPSGDLRSDASERLYQLYNEKNGQTQHLQKTLDRLVKTHELENVLQDKFVTTREGRWVIPVKSGMQHDIEGIIHASSESKQTVFMEPQEVVVVNNRIRQIQMEIEEEIERILREISGYLFDLCEAMERNAELLLEVDIFLAKAQLALTLNARPVSFSKNKLSLKNLRHPVLSLQNKNVVANDILLNQEQRVLLLSGPNAGGKTVLLKSIGLAALMASCGLLVCCDEDSSLPFFKQVHIGVGDSQSVDQHLSTFAAHLKVLDRAAKAKGSDQLLLIDEICSSTDPEEGAALARSFIDTFCENGVYAVVTSHLSALKQNWAKGSGVINGSLEFNSESGPTYQFLSGVPGQSLAIATAKRVGIDKGILEQASKYMSPDQKLYQSKIEEADQIRQDLLELRKDMAEKQKQISRDEQKYKKLVKEIEENREKLLQKAKEEAQQEIDKLIKAAMVDKTFKRHENLIKVKEQIPQVVKASEAPRAPTMNSADDFIKKYPPGSKLFSTTLNRDAVIQGQPNNKGEVPVLSNSMRVFVPWQTLQPARSQNNTTKLTLRQSKHFQHSVIQDDRSIDVRGMKSDEALSQLEVQMDAAALNGEDRIKIIHGHGTETLKRAVRGYLSRSMYVKKWTAGNKINGGDGVTWVELS